MVTALLLAEAGLIVGLPIGVLLRRATARRVQRGRRVRLHLLDGNGQPGETVEGIQLGRRAIGGHYVLTGARLLEATDRSIALEGQTEVPAARVLLVQVLT